MCDPEFFQIPYEILIHRIIVDFVILAPAVAFGAKRAGRGVFEDLSRFWPQRIFFVYRLGYEVMLAWYEV